VSTTPAARPERDADAVLRYVEHLGLLFTESGMARMPARVFSALLVTDAGRLTAPELASLLQVSPAAISGALRYLGQVGMVNRGREPGQRRDHYLVRDDLWFEAIMSRDQVLRRWVAGVREGVALLGAETPAGARMADTLAFLEFMLAELPALMEKWQATRQADGG
jgi:DNA-binding transcriptional regulator GbsR (MarR family)